MIVVGLTGGMGQGKSTVGAKLRELAGADYKADLEFSFVVSEVANDWIATWPKPLVQQPNQALVDVANELVETLPPIIEARTGKTADSAKLIIDDSELHSRLLHYLGKWLGLNDEERAVQLPTPVEPANKALHRALLQWIGGGLIEMVSPTIWDEVIDRRIKQLDGRDYKLVTLGGVRYPQDVTMLHANGGLLVRVIRPNAEISKDATEVQKLVPDVELINDGTLVQLYNEVERLYRDIMAGSVKPTYHAAA